MKSANVVIVILGDQVVNFEFTNGLVLPIVMHDRIGRLLFVNEPAQKYIRKLIEYLLFFILYFLVSKDRVVGLRVKAENLLKELVGVFFSILNGLYYDLNVNLLSLFVQLCNAHSFLFLSPLLLLFPPLFDNLVNLPTLFLLNHIIQLYFFILFIFLHFLQ